MASASTSAAGTLMEERAAWQRRLDASLDCLRTLLSPAQQKSKAWRPAQVPPQPQGAAQQQQASQQQTSVAMKRLSSQSTANVMASPKSRELRLSAGPDALPASPRRRPDRETSWPLGTSDAPIQVHRRSAKRSNREDGAASASNPLLPPDCASNADIYRATCHLPAQGDFDDMACNDVLATMRTLLSTPECRPAWDDMVEDSTSIEELDATTRVTRTIFKLGWPASQRDAITISRTYKEDNALVDISTSLPRSPDAPAYLRPAPPYVRSHVNLFAWCLERSNELGRPSIKISVFWSWDLRGAWLGMPAGGLGARLPQMITSLAQQAREGGATRVPSLSRFGSSIEVTERSFDVSRDLLTVRYQVIPEDNESQGSKDDIRLEWLLPAAEGWDVHVKVLALEHYRKADAQWGAKAKQPVQGEARSSWTTLYIQHGRDARSEEMNGKADGFRGEVTIQRIAASQDVRLRVNDRPQVITTVPWTADSTEGPSGSVLTNAGSASTDDGASISAISLQSEHSSNGGLAEEMIKRASTPVNGQAKARNGSISATSEVMASPVGAPNRAPVDRMQAITALVRRNYIYFTSLLQEPEQKWKQYSDSRGVTITQLDSIDPTLVVFRAEATFVNVTTWDIFAAIGNPSVKSIWDKGIEDSQLLQDVGDATRLWWTKMRGTWPVSARDSVTLETSYKSQNSAHLFAFSTDDQKMFPSIPRPTTGTIRTQTDLRGWSIESLNPSTVHVTLIEQSDPKGWTSKSAATPAAMTAAVAGVGDFVIKNGSPPIVTRLLGAKLRLMKYEHDKAAYRIEYELSSDAKAADVIGNIECEIRCDVETWAPSIDVVIDPPPINVSCLRRHKLSSEGSGLWLTIEQPSASLEDESSRITLRRSASKERGTLSVNGASIKVDVDDLSEEQVAQLKDKKRSKPRRVPLDLMTNGPSRPMTGSSPPTTPISRSGTPAELPKSPLTKSPLPASKREMESEDASANDRPVHPMTSALDGLYLLRRVHAERNPDPAVNPAGWSLVSQRGGHYVRRRLMESISTTVAVQRGDKVVEGLTAEDVLGAVAPLGCRRLWDDKIDSTKALESYGNGASTGFFTTKASFPFRGRGFYLASLTARSGPATQQFSGPTSPTVYFHASASYSSGQAEHDADKLNPSSLPLGRVLVDGWIIETLDPYSSTLNYQIPSTRVTHLIAIDFCGSLPAAVNAIWNSQLARSIVAVEEWVKGRGSLPLVRQPPACFELVGDEREDSRDLRWSLKDEIEKRPSTLLSTSFDPDTRIAAVLLQLPAHAASDALDTKPVQLAKPTPLRPSPQVEGDASTLSSVIARPGSNTSIKDLTTDTSAPGDHNTIPRATSASSIRSMGLRPRASLARLNESKPKDVVLLDLEVDVRHFQSGYDIVPSSEFGRNAAKERGRDSEAAAKGPEEKSESAGMASGVKGSTDSSNSRPAPLSLRAASASSQALPLEVTVFDLPPSAVLAATLDPALRPKKHLVRLSLPTSAFANGHNQDVLEQDLADAPEWFRELQRRGAAARLTIRPHIESAKAAETSEQKEAQQEASTSDDEADFESARVPVFVAGKPVSIVHVNKTSAMLQREGEQEQVHAVLDRVSSASPQSKVTPQVPKDESGDDDLPDLLRKPTAVAIDLRKKPRSNTDDDAKTPNANKAALPTMTPSPSVDVFSQPKTPTPSSGQNAEPAATLTTPASGDAKSKQTTTSPSSAASAQILSILNSYPLSRLGASTAVSTTAASGGLFSTKGRDEASQASDKKDGESSNDTTNTSKSEEASASAPSSELNAALQAMPGQLMAQTEELRRRMSDVRFSLSTLVLVGVIAFLLGSLVRSLLAPADFVLVDALSERTSADGPQQGPETNSMHSATMDEVYKILSNRQGDVAAPHTLATGDAAVAWRELKRLVEIRNVLGMRWDFVVAAARRQ